MRLARPGPGDRGPVVIGTITDARTLNPAGTSSVTNQATLVGQHVKSADKVYDVVLVGGKDVTDITREIIAISLTRMGYIVVDSNDAAGTANDLESAAKLWHELSEDQKVQSAWQPAK